MAQRVRGAKLHESCSRLPVTLIQAAIAGKSLTQPECYLHPGLHVIQSGGLVILKHKQNRKEMEQMEMREVSADGTKNRE